MHADFIELYKWHKEFKHQLLVDEVMFSALSQSLEQFFKIHSTTLEDASSILTYDEILPLIQIISSADYTKFCTYSIHNTVKFNQNSVASILSFLYTHDYLNANIYSHLINVSLGLPQNIIDNLKQLENQQIERSEIQDKFLPIILRLTHELDDNPHKPIILANNIPIEHLIYCF